MPSPSVLPTTQNPFGQPDPQSRPTMGMRTLLVVMVVFAVISLLLALAIRVPAVARSVDDWVGTSRSAAGAKSNDRSSHLFLLLFCYTSPLLLMIWVGLFQKVSQGRRSHPADTETFPDPLA